MMIDLNICLDYLFCFFSSRRFNYILSDFNSSVGGFIPCSSSVFVVVVASASISVVDGNGKWV